MARSFEVSTEEAKAAAWQGNQHNFVGSLDEWEDRVFAAGNSFRLHRFSGNKTWEENSSSRFDEAMAMAVQALQGGYRVLVYVVTDRGRSFCIPQERWPSYLAAWQRRKQ
jgi:hypothetical protein